MFSFGDINLTSSKTHGQNSALHTLSTYTISEAAPLADLSYADTCISCSQSRTSTPSHRTDRFAYHCITATCMNPLLLRLRSFFIAHMAG